MKFFFFELLIKLFLLIQWLQPVQIFYNVSPPGGHTVHSVQLLRWNAACMVGQAAVQLYTMYSIYILSGTAFSPILPMLMQISD
jgi:hypothetical protein